METIYDLQRKAKLLSDATMEGSITPALVGGLHSGTLAYIARMEQSAAGGLGIRQVYKTSADMQAETNKAVGSDGKPLKFGQLVIIYDSSNPSAAESNDIYAWQSPGWLKIGNLDAYGKVQKYESQLAELDAVVFPLTLTVGGGGVYEKGTSQTVIIAWSMKKGGSPTTPDSVKLNSQPVTGDNKVFAGVTANTIYTVEAAKGSVTKTASTFAKFVNPSYLGVVPASFAPSESAIKVLTKAISESKSRTLSGANLANQKVCYAYPKAFGALASIKDANNFDYINSYSRTELAINGETYYVYVLKDATSVSAFKQAFN